MLIRGLILAVWLVLLSTHVVRHAAPGLGLGERNAAREVFAVQLGRTLHYRLLGADDQRMGTVSCSFREESGHFVEELSVSLDADAAIIATAREAVAALGRGTGNARSPVAGQVEINYDDKFRPTAVQVHAMAFGVPLTAELAMDHRGLTGWYLMAGTRQGIAMPEIGPSSLTSLDLSLAMPPGLRPGDAWTNRALGSAGMGLTVRTVVNTVTAAETVDTAAGPVAALRVSTSAGGSAATLWVDDRGTALRLSAAGLHLVLDRVVAADGRVLWPPRPEDGLPLGSSTRSAVIGGDDAARGR